MKHVKIYTDGACSGNPGPGGWACVLIYGKTQKEVSGYDPHTTNNRMELTAAISGLDLLKESCSVDIYTDSAYLNNAFNKHWIDNWLNNGWKTSQKKDVENVDLWKRLVDLNQKHIIVFHKVKGHADNPYNNRCDSLATGEIKKHRS